ncbi:MAG TPA: ABC transporter ATP-binding protein [Rhizomicrobium sp.]|nr:ABC transporter ATP-binding protein [Rhizomicrobium sp.]
MSDIAIRVEGLGKRYPIQTGGARYKSLRDVLTGAFTAPFRPRPERKKGDFWALKDISFDVKAGQVVGLIGRNGAGKSTLLKVLSRITEPTTGFAEIHGRVGSLLEVGTGFHPELSGRENIFLNGAILGMKRAEIVRKFDEIVAFAEIDRFIDQPVKFYSSGMFVRLAFAVAAHLEPEILFVDEVLAVGDAAFQKKCLGKMGDVARSGRTVVLVSHNMGAISELCTHGVLLDGGQVALVGEVEQAVEGYGKMLAGSSHQVALEEVEGRAVSITGARITNGEGMASTTFDIHDDIRIAFEYVVRERQYGLQMSANVSRNYIDVFRTFDTDGHEVTQVTEPGNYRCTMSIPAFFLKAGHYSVDINAGTPQAVLQNVEGVVSFDIEELSENTLTRGYRQDRPGHIIFPGKWITERV